MYYDLIEGLLNRPIFPTPQGQSAGLTWSIRNNLKLLLNTRRGALPHIPDYGLPDISVIYKEFPDSLEMLRRAIANSIRRYEPRLTDVVVKLIDRENKVFRAMYMISAEIIDVKDDGNIVFNMQINADGQMEIL